MTQKAIQNHQTNDSNTVVNPIYPPYAQDIRNLIVLFLNEKNFTFQSFKDCWKKMNFTMIHYGIPDDISPDMFLTELYQTCIGESTWITSDSNSFKVTFY